MTSLRQVLALNMKAQRHALGLSQAKLAERVNAAPTYIAMIEIQKQVPSVEMLERIAAALNLDTPELFAGGDSPAVSMKKMHEKVLAEIESLAILRLKDFETDLTKMIQGLGETGAE